MFNSRVAGRQGKGCELFEEEVKEEEGELEEEEKVEVGGGEGFTANFWQ